MLSDEWLYPFLEMNEQKLHEEGHVVAGVKAVPDCEEHERRNMTDVLVVEKLEALVDVLENP